MTAAACRSINDPTVIDNLRELITRYDLANFVHIKHIKIAKYYMLQYYYYMPRSYI